MIPMKRSETTDILIIGGSFAGLKAAGALPRKFKVRVIDPRPWFEFLPAIHELISGTKTPEMLRLSKASILKRMGHILVADTVKQVDPSKNQAITRSGAKISFDFCVIATGGENNTFNVKEAVYHLIMAEFDPSGPVAKAYHASERAVTAAFDLALPMLFSPSSLARLTNIRILN